MAHRDQYKRIIKFLSSITAIALQVFVYWNVWVGYYNDNIELPFFRRGSWLMVALYAVLLFFFVQTYGGLRVGYLRKWDIIYSQILAAVWVNMITYVQICLLDRHFVNARPLIVMTVLQMALIAAWATLFQWMYSRIFPPRRMLLVHGDRPAFGLMDKINTREDKYDICEMVNIDQGMDKVFERICLYEGVIIGDIPSQERNHIMKYCFERSIRAYVLPKLSDILIRGSEDIHLFDTPLLLSRNSGLTIEQRFGKRFADIILSLVGIVVSSPFMLLTALAILIQDGRPVIHKQTRLTEGGREFELYKFRSMVKDAEKDGVARLASEQDVRVTPVGRVIRRTRLDELPQFFNILKGEMSLVGPRPERPQIAAEYREYMPEFDYRLKVRAGLTGYAQIYGKYNTTPYDKLKLDLMYIENFSFRLDLKLILMTVKILFMKESTDGVAEGQITATVAEDGGYKKELPEGSGR